MSSGHDKRITIADREADEALADKEVRRRLARSRRLDHTWDIPYLGGYSENGNTIYLDRHLPAMFVFRGRHISANAFLRLHEEVEKALIDILNMRYGHAHEIATREEERAVRAIRLSVPWYRKVLKPFIKSDEHKLLLRVPADLDMTPYRAPPVSEKLLQRMQRAMRDPAPPGKIDPKEAQYGPGQGHAEHCGACAYFKPPHGCMVLPRAAADMWCKFYVRAAKQDGE
jgi:hypothetical protein